MSGSPTLALLKGNKNTQAAASVHDAGGGEDLFPVANAAENAEAEAILGGGTTSVQAPKPKKAVAKKVKNEVNVVTSPVSGEVPGADLLATTAHEIENLTAEQAHAMIGNLSETTDFNAFKLGGVLSKIYAEKWFGEYDDFKTYVETVHSFKLRKAFYLVKIYDSIISLGLPWEGTLKTVGWSKLKELTEVITPENAKEWLETAADPKMTVIKLHQLVQASKNEGQAQLEGGEGKTNPTVTKTFKLHEDQNATVSAALDKAMKVGSTDIPSVALEYMALDYLGNSEKAASADSEIDEAVKPMAVEPGATEAPAFEAYMAQLGWEETLVVFEKCWPTLNLTVEDPTPA
jgi:hypothetical protein